jgi:hypothetical protein
MPKNTPTETTKLLKSMVGNLIHQTPPYPSSATKMPAVSEEKTPPTSAPTPLDDLSVGEAEKKKSPVPSPAGTQPSSGEGSKGKGVKTTIYLAGDTIAALQKLSGRLKSHSQDFSWEPSLSELIRAASLLAAKQAIPADLPSKIRLVNKRSIFDDAGKTAQPN